MTIKLGEKSDSINIRNETKPILTKKTNIMQDNESEIVLYSGRWIYLLLFVFASATNGFNWVELTIITDIVEEYYNVSTLAVTWTSMLYFVPYIPLIFPATWYLQNKGLRSTIILGALGTCLGCWIKLFGTRKSGFPIVFAGQTLTAISEVFILGIPSELAATWFPQNQISLACAIGVFGNQMGVALGFLLPPIIVRRHEDMLDSTLVGSDLFTLFLSLAVVTTIVLILIVTLFPDWALSSPRKSESYETLSPESSPKESSYFSGFCSSIQSLLNNAGFRYLLIAYGIIVGIYYAISSLLTVTLLHHFENIDSDSGRIGLVIVVAGMFGSIIFGVILDKTHAYKRLTLILCSFSFLGMVFYSIAMYSSNLSLIYISAGVLGFFMTGYLPVGFEFGVEMTYPESEGTSCGLLNASAKVFALIFTLGGEQLMAHFDDTLVHIMMGSALFICTILTVSIRFTKVRQKVYTSYSTPSSISTTSR